MKISARNILKGKIVEVVKGQTTAHVSIDKFRCIILGEHRDTVDQCTSNAGRRHAPRLSP